MQIPIVVVGAGSTTAASLVPMLLQETDSPLLLITGSNIELDHNRVQIRKIDVTNRLQLKNAILAQMPATIINLAAYTNVDGCEADRTLAWKLNVTLVEQLVRLARSCDAHLIHVSSDYVFDGERGPYTEADIPAPINYYGKSKLAGENAVAAAGITSTIVRTNVVYSPTPSRMDFVHYIISSLDEGKPVRIASDQYSNPTYVEDLAEAILRIAVRKVTGLYHVGGADYLSRADFALQIADFFRLNKKLVQPLESSLLMQTARRPLRAGLVNLKAESTLGMRFRGVESGLVSLRHILFAGK